MTKPRWWNDEELKIVSARVVVAAPNFEGAHHMLAMVLSGLCDVVWEVGPRSAAELKDAAAHFELSVALCGAHIRGSSPVARTGAVAKQRPYTAHSHADRTTGAPTTDCQCVAVSVCVIMGKKWYCLMFFFFFLECTAR